MCWSWQGGRILFGHHKPEAHPISPGLLHSQWHTLPGNFVDVGSRSEPGQSTVFRETPRIVLETAASRRRSFWHFFCNWSVRWPTPQCRLKAITNSWGISAKVMGVHLLTIFRSSWRLRKLYATFFPRLPPVRERGTNHCEYRESTDQWQEARGYLQESVDYVRKIGNADSRKIPTKHSHVCDKLLEDMPNVELLFYCEEDDTKVSPCSSKQFRISPRLRMD